MKLLLSYGANKAIASNRPRTEPERPVDIAIKTRQFDLIFLLHNASWSAPESTYMPRRYDNEIEIEATPREERRKNSGDVIPRREMDVVKEFILQRHSSFVHAKKMNPSSPATRLMQSRKFSASSASPLPPQPKEKQKRRRRKAHSMYSLANDNICATELASIRKCSVVKSASQEGVNLHFKLPLENGLELTSFDAAACQDGKEGKDGEEKKGKLIKGLPRRDTAHGEGKDPMRDGEGGKEGKGGKDHREEKDGKNKKPPHVHDVLKSIRNEEQQWTEEQFLREYIIFEEVLIFSLHLLLTCLPSAFCFSVVNIKFLSISLLIF
mgnify:CR=1 FL=1